MTLAKGDFIAKYGKDAYEKMLERSAKAQSGWRKENSVKVAKYQREFKVRHPERAESHRQESVRKGGKYYEKQLIQMQSGIPGAKTRIRNNHAYKYRPYKNIIAPGSQIHHEWIPGTADYRGIALVEADPHMHGFVDVIEVLEGMITLLSEEEIRGGERHDQLSERISA